MAKEWFEFVINFKVDGKDVHFKIYHNIPGEGNINTAYTALDNWLARTQDHTEQSFVAYINSKGIYKAYTQEEWERILNH